MEKMNFKYSMFLLLVLGLGLWGGCDDKDEVETVNNQPPGTEYVKEGNQCLNVVYYIPKGGDTLDNWHRTISGMVLEQQELYRQMMTGCGYEGKTFCLNVNKQNPNYIMVSLVQGEVDSIADKSMAVLAYEIEAYFSSHPLEKMSTSTLIFAPASGLAELRLDERSSITVFTQKYPGAGESLSPGNKGLLAQLLGRLFCLPNSAEPIQDVYYSLMNQIKVNYWSVKGVEMKKPDAMWLDRHPLFNPETQGYADTWPVVTVSKAEFEYSGEEIHVNCEFTSGSTVVGVIVVHDPWTEDDRNRDILDNTSTLDESIPYAVDKLTRNGSQYAFTLSIPWNDMPSTYKIPVDDSGIREAELRFRFILEDGMTVPVMYRTKGDIKSGYRYPYVIRDLVPDFSTVVDVDLKPDENTD